MIHGPKVTEALTNHLSALLFTSYISHTEAQLTLSQ